MSSLRIVVSSLILGAGLASSAAAQQPNGYPITDVNLRAGPGTEYPVILTVPADAAITILGCVPDYTWCDSVFQDRRGWMRSIYLSGYSEGDYYLLRDYAPDRGYQRVTFNIDAYWDSYYRDEPFYGDRGRWAGPREAGWVDDGVFYDRLSPHGSWTWIQGRYVWVPAGVDRGWRPYTRGRWVYTDRGWTWASNEPFGWATYHYGRWGFSDRVGWFWTPGNQWAPAWVSWRQSDDYLAWAPLPPSYDRGYERGYERGDDRNGGGINISFGDVPDYYWSMVPSRDFLSDDLPRHYVHDRARRRRDFERTRPIGHTTIVNKTVVNNVVNVNYVEQKTKTKVVERHIAATDNAEQAGKVEGDTLEVYEPQADETPEAKAPSEPKDVKTVAEASETKAQAEGDATTEDMLAPPEVQEAAKARKGRKRQKAEAEAKGEAALPEGDIADTPPPAAKTAKEAPVPAHEVASPKTDESAPEAKTEPGAEPKTESDAKPDAEVKKPVEETDAAPKNATPKEAEPKDSAPKDSAPKDSAPKETEPKETEPKEAEPKHSEPKAAEPEKPKAEPKAEAEEEPKAESKAGAEEKPAAAEEPEPKDAGKDKTEKPSKKDAAPADKAPEPAEAKDETPPAPKQEMPPEEDKPAKAEKPKTPEAKTPQDKTPQGKTPAAEETPEAKTSGPKEPEAKKAEPEKPEPKKPVAKKPEAKKAEPEKPEPKNSKNPEPKKPEAKNPEPEKPEAKKAEPEKPEPKKPVAKTPEPEKPEPKKPEAKKPARTPQRKTPPATKREAKQAPAKAKPTERTAQGPAPQGAKVPAKAPAKGKKRVEKDKD